MNTWNLIVNMARCKSISTANTSQLTREAAASNSRTAPAHSRTVTSNRRTVEEISDADELPGVSKIAMSKSARGKAPVVGHSGLGSIFTNGGRAVMLKTFIACNESESCSEHTTC